MVSDQGCENDADDQQLMEGAFRLTVRVLAGAAAGLNRKGSIAQRPKKVIPQL